MRVVILDDEKKVLDLICALIDWDALDLQLAGTAGDGEEALRLIEREKPDLLITDIKMPGMSGIKIIEKAKAFLPALRAIVISGYSRFDYAQSAIRQGVINYLLKPINKQELNGTLQKIIADAVKTAEDASRARAAEERARSLTFERGKAALLAVLNSETASTDTGIEYPLASIDGEKSPISRVFGIEPPIVFIAIKIDSVLFPCDMRVEKEAEERITAYLNAAGEENGGAVAAAKDSIVLAAFGGIEYAKEIGSAVFSEVKKQQEIFSSLNFTLSYSTSALQALSALEMRLLHGVGRVYHACANGILNNGKREVQGGDAADGGKSTQADSSNAASGRESNALNARMQSILMPLFASMVSGEEAEYKKRRAVVMEQFNSSTGYRDKAWIAREMTDIATEEARLRLTEQSAPLAAIDAMALTVNMSRSIEEMASRIGQFLDAVYEAVAEDAREKYVRPVREAQQYIAAHYGDNMLCLDSVAEYVELSPNYLSALFKKNCAVGMAEYIQNIRMEKAKEQLRETHGTIKQIAYSVGFNDPKHFSKTFKQVVGVKPNEYRKLYE